MEYFMNQSMAQQKFPAYFANFTMPDGAKPLSIAVFRACATGKVDEPSFLNTFEADYGANTSKVDEKDVSNPSIYSLSVYEKYKDVKRFATMTSKYKVPFTIAKGTTSLICGIMLQSHSKKSSHVDWWLYKKAKPHRFFKVYTV